MNLKWVVFLFIIIFSVSCKKDTQKDKEINIQHHNELNSIEMNQNYGVGVVNVDRLRLRGDHDLHSKTLRYLDKGAIIKILSKDTSRVKIDMMEDFWYEVQFEGIQGWVFGHYIDVYTDYDNARMSSDLYKKQSKIDFHTIDSSTSADEKIYQNIFFLSSGNLCQVTDVKKGTGKILLQDNESIVKYYPGSEKNKIYFLKKNDFISDKNGTLYSYLLDGEKTIELISKDVYFAAIDKADDQAVVVTRDRKNLKEFWRIVLYNLKEKKEIREVVELETGKNDEIQENDYLLRSMIREKGCLMDLEWNRKSNVIRFKPPEENQVYIISVQDGNYIKVDDPKPDFYEVDNSRLIVINSEIESGKTFYSIVLKDRIVGLEKEIIRSSFYPIAFSLSPRENYLLLSMIDTSKVDKFNCYQSSIYLLSLVTFSFIPVSTDGESYQPMWSY